MSESLTYAPMGEYPALQLFDLLLEPSPSGAENKVAELSVFDNMLATLVAFMALWQGE